MVDSDDSDVSTVQPSPGREKQVYMWQWRGKAELMKEVFDKDNDAVDAHMGTGGEWGVYPSQSMENPSPSQSIQFIDPPPGWHFKKPPIPPSEPLKLLTKPVHFYSFLPKNAPKRSF